jgi:hypothetical protein
MNDRRARCLAWRVRNDPLTWISHKSQLDHLSSLVWWCWNFIESALVAAQTQCCSNILYAVHPCHSVNAKMQSRLHHEVAKIVSILTWRLCWYASRLIILKWEIHGCKLLALLETGRYQCAHSPYKKLLCGGNPIPKTPYTNMTRSWRHKYGKQTRPKNKHKHILPYMVYRAENESPYISAMRQS